MKVAAAPISWGVCEVPGWGAQVPSARVLREAAALGFRAIESGPPGFLPADARAARRLLDDHGLALVAGFVTAVLHESASREKQLAAVRRQAEWLAAGGAEVLVLAAAAANTGYETRSQLDERAWAGLFDAVEQAGALARELGLALAVHPHVGTVIDRRAEVERFLSGCDAGLCIDTGHLFIGGCDPADLVRRAADRVRHVHLKDVDRALASAVAEGKASYADAVKRGLYRQLGAGDAGIDEVLHELRASQYRGWYVLEQDVALTERQASAGSFPWIAESLRYVSARVA
jgi:inosose dehydratase